ncbi:hypothetical protein XENOCAPTIV_014380 [Xenoophorus captivus]|uniref:Uncharacterized protein n=1 Tax=Xenoophorus captivus TaxID=1517983 RepID=A0ABV0QRT2_9TELE
MVLGSQKRPLPLPQRLFSTPLFSPSRQSRVLQVPLPASKVPDLRPKLPHQVYTGSSTHRGWPPDDLLLCRRPPNHLLLRLSLRTLVTVADLLDSYSVVAALLEVPVIATGIGCQDLYTSGLMNSVLPRDNLPPIHLKAVSARDDFTTVFLNNGPLRLPWSGCFKFLILLFFWL